MALEHTKKRRLNIGTPGLRENAGKTSFYFKRSSIGEVREGENRESHVSPFFRLSSPAKVELQGLCLLAYELQMSRAQLGEHFPQVFRAYYFISGV